MFLHSNKTDMLKDIPLKYLPREYGGENSSIEEILDVWEKKLDEYREYFKNNEQYGVDEMLRPGKAIDFDSMFGLEGSFRKLDVD